MVERFVLEADPGAPMPPPAFLEHLARLPFPGNVRELRSLVRRALVLGWDEALGQLAPPEPRGDAAPALRLVPGLKVREPVGRYSQSFAEIRDHVILDALARAGGNRAAAARLIQMPKTTFAERLKRIDQAKVAGLAGAALAKEPQIGPA
jgi:DNA-binding NtrC family response regulator